MTSFDSQDRASRRQEDRVGNERRGTEVGSDAQVLDDTGGGSHGRHIGQHGVEVERAGCDRCLAQRLDGSREDSRVGRFVKLDGGELLDGDLWRRESRCREIRLLELLERLRVELCLELLKNMGKLCTGAIRSRFASRCE